MIQDLDFWGGFFSQSWKLNIDLMEYFLSVNSGSLSLSDCSLSSFFGTGDQGRNNVIELFRLRMNGFGLWDPLLAKQVHGKDELRI